MAYNQDAGIFFVQENAGLTERSGRLINTCRIHNITQSKSNSKGQSQQTRNSETGGIDTSQKVGQTFDLRIENHQQSQLLNE